MLTSSKLGKALGLSKATIIRLAKDGRIPSIVLPSGHRRFDVEEVKAALSADPFASVFLVQEGGQK
jgi:excisionase family DNA binding protein